MMTEPVPFKEITDGYQVGERLFFRLDGLEYILRLIQNQSESITSCELYSGKEHCAVRGGENERCRQNVRRSIKAAIIKIIEQDETEEIGLHLMDTIKTGSNCVYTGNWDWEL